MPSEKSCPACDTYIEGAVADECPRCGYEFSPDEFSELESRTFPQNSGGVDSKNRAEFLEHEELSYREFAIKLFVLISLATAYFFGFLHLCRLLLHLDSFQQTVQFLFYCLGTGYLNLFLLSTAILLIATCRMAIQKSTRQAKWLYLWFAMVPLMIGIYGSLYVWAYIYDRSFVDEAFPGKDLSRAANLSAMIVGAVISAPAIIWMGIWLGRGRHNECFSADLSNSNIIDDDLDGENITDDRNVRRSESQTIPIISLLAPVVGQIAIIGAGQPNIWFAVVLTIVFTTTLQGMDLYRLQKKEDRVVPKTDVRVLIVGMLLLWIVFYPYSFLRRRIYAKPNLFLIAVFSSLSIVYMPMASIAIERQLYGPQLPRCDDVRVQNSVKRMLEKLIPGRTDYTVSDFKEVEYDAESEVRRGTFQIRIQQFPDQIQTREFKLSWNEKDRGIYKVEILPLFGR